MLRAAIFHQINNPLKVADVETPKVGPKDALIRVRACGICHSDIHYIRGRIEIPKMPAILGHEVAGEIVEVGSEVEYFSSGDRVVLSYIYSTCGKCYYCKFSFENLCDNLIRTGYDTDGGYAEYVKAPASSLIKLPRELSYEEGAVLTDAVASPYHAIKRIAKVEVGENVAIFGIGGLGINAVQLANLSGARVIAIDIIKEKLDIAKKLGAEETINAREVDPVKRIMEITKNMGVDVAIEIVGSPITIKQAINSVKKKGKAIILGVYNDEVGINPFYLLWNELTIQSSKGFIRQDVSDVVELARIGKLKVKQLVTHRVALDKINDGIKMVETGQAPDKPPIRVVVNP